MSQLPLSSAVIDGLVPADGTIGRPLTRISCPPPIELVNHRVPSEARKASSYWRPGRPEFEGLPSCASADSVMKKPLEFDSHCREVLAWKVSW